MNSFWTHELIDGDLARALRRDIRLKRREKGRGGHRFRYDDLVELMQCGSHVLVTHKEDQHWQHWYRDGDDGWKLQGWHDTLGAAKVAVEAFSPPAKTPGTPGGPGLYVRATWPRQDRPRGIRVKCATPRTAAALEDIFTKLGYEARQETVLVGAPANV